MLEVVRRIPDPERVAAWLERHMREHLTPDVSNYAKGRLRAWLGTEPSLTTPVQHYPGIPVEERVLRALADRIEWDFDFCLVTYSGDGETGAGIAPHRDAGYANYEAVSLHLTGQCRFDYWLGYPELGYTRNHTFYEVDRARGVVMLDKQVVAPTHQLVMQPGLVTRFNCKNPHSATPGPARWNLNFWRAKPPR